MTGFAARLRGAATIEELSALLGEIARELGFSYHALVQHADIARPPRRFGVTRRTQLAVAAVSHGLVGLDDVVTWQYPL